MAEGLNITDTTYAGEAASIMVLLAVEDLDSINKGCLMVKDDIKKQYTLPRLDIQNFIQARAATPVSSGIVNIDGKLLVPADYMVYIEFNPRDFEAHWFAPQLQDRLLDRQLPQTAESFLIYQLLRKVNEFNENQLWRGRTAYAPANGGLDPTTKNAPAGDSKYQYHNGLIYKLLNDAGTIQIGSPATLTSGNIVAAMFSVMNSIPIALVDKKGADGVKFIMSKSTKRIYDNALTANTYKDTQTTDSTKEAFQGYEIKVLAGCSDNTIIAALALPNPDSAFWLGLNSTQDEQTVDLKQVQANSELWFVKMLMKADVQFAWSQQVVLYTTITL